MKKEIRKRFLMTFVLLLTNIVYSQTLNEGYKEVTINYTSIGTGTNVVNWTQNGINFKSINVENRGLGSVFQNFYQGMAFSGNSSVVYNATSSGLIKKIEAQVFQNFANLTNKSNFKLYTSNIADGREFDNGLRTSSGITSLITWDLSSNTERDYFVIKNEDAKEARLIYIKLTLLESTIWNGTSWSNGRPNSKVKAIIRGGYNSGFADSNGKVEAKSVIIESDITIPKGITIQSVNELNNSLNKNVIFEDKSYFLQTNPLAVNLGNVTFKVKSQKMKRNDMTHWSSPVTGQYIRAFSPETLYNRFWYYNETTSNYKTVFTSANSSDVKFEAGKGVAIRLKHGVAVDFEESIVGEFKGVLNNGEVKVAVNKTETSNGFNFVGNPYPSNINLKEFFNQNQSVDKIFIWTPYFKIDHPNFGNNYITINRDGVVSPRLDDGTNMNNISVGQGFFVQVDSPSEIIFTPSMRTNTEATMNRGELNLDRFWLNFSEGDTRINQIMIGYFDGATDEEDFQRDARTVETGSKKIYTLIDENQFSIQSRTYPLNQEDVVKLGFVTDKHGQLKISLGDTEGIFGNEQSVYLKDNLLGIIHDLKDSDYVFESEEGKFDNRFEVLYTKGSLSTTNEINENSNVLIYNDVTGVIIKSNIDLLHDLFVYNQNGQLVYLKNNLNSNVLPLNLTSGIYFIKVILKNNNVFNKKIIVL